MGADLVGGGQGGQDCDGHGTHVGGTIVGRTYGVAKDVRWWLSGSWIVTAAGPPRR